jgi:hypothetical protein
MDAFIWGWVNTYYYHLWGNKLDKHPPATHDLGSVWVPGYHRTVVFLVTLWLFNIAMV